jgi:hypothetical protein
MTDADFLVYALIRYAANHPEIDTEPAFAALASGPVVSSKSPILTAALTEIQPVMLADSQTAVALSGQAAKILSAPTPISP